MDNQDWKGKQIDKDILFMNNKVYSPSTCVFVTQAVNLFVVDRKLHRGEWPIGVHFDKYSSKFKAECNNPFTKKSENLGRFTDPDSAHQAWLKRKLELAKMLAQLQEDQRVANALIARYENYEECL